MHPEFVLSNNNNRRTLFISVDISPSVTKSTLFACPPTWKFKGFLTTTRRARLEKPHAVRVVVVHQESFVPASRFTQRAGLASCR